jgi:hypothetical protein
VLVSFDHVGSRIVNANHDRMGTAIVRCVCDSIADRIGFAVPQPTEGQRIRN